MHSDIPFFTLFSNIDTPELRTQIPMMQVSGVDLDAGTRSVAVEVRCERYVPASLLRDCEQALIRAYGLRDARVTAVFPAEELPKLEPAEITRILAEAYSPARGILAGSRWQTDTDANCVHIHLQANGADELKPHLRHASE